MDNFSNMATGLMPENFVSCNRLCNVEGTTGRRNDIIFCGNKFTKPQKNVIFFGGDIQDYSENMLEHKDNKRHEKWNLEETARLLQAKFDNSHIWIVKPSKMYMKTFSVYGNFVESDMVGSPVHSPHFGAWSHLSQLLVSASVQVNNRFDLAKSEYRQEIFPTSTNLPMVIIGFSKGCVVLNQLLHELHIAKENLHSFVDLVVQMFWLDGGHNGGSETWITDSEILKSLLGTKTEIRVHVTPYQVRDESRRWIGQEHEKFVENLRRHGVNVFDTIHFVDEERCLDKHFDVLRVF